MFFFNNFTTTCSQKTSNGRYYILRLLKFGSLVKSTGTRDCFLAPIPALFLIEVVYKIPLKIQSISKLAYIAHVLNKKDAMTLLSLARKEVLHAT